MDIFHNNLLNFLTSHSILTDSSSLNETTFRTTKDYPAKYGLIVQNKYWVVGKYNDISLYCLDLKTLDPYTYDLIKDLKNRFINELLDLLPQNKDQSLMDIEQRINYVLNSNQIKNSEMLSYVLTHEVFGYGPISMLISDSNIDNILIDSPTSNIWINHKKYGHCKTNIRFSNQNYLDFVINKLIKDANNNSSPYDLSIVAKIQQKLTPLENKLYLLNNYAVSIKPHSNCNVNPSSIMESDISNPAILAYLWMALETRCNILISGLPSSGKSSLLYVLSSFLPRHHEIIAANLDLDRIRLSSNIVTTVQSNTTHDSISDQILNHQSKDYDTIVVDNINAKTAKIIFNSSNLCNSFIAAIQTQSNENIFDFLYSTPKLIDNNILNMLDIEVVMRRNGEIKRSIDKIIEYKWLSRAEYTLNELDKEPKTAKIVSNSSIDYDALERSKVIAAYSKMHMVDTNSAIKELKTRELFLHQTAKTSDPYLDYMIAYDQIR